MVNPNWFIAAQNFIPIVGGTTNLFLGYQSGYNILSGTYNVGLGYQTLFGNPLFSSYNVGIGYRALFADTSGSNNVAIGYLNGSGIYSGAYNTSIGAQAYGGGDGNYNTADGFDVMFLHRSGNSNAAFGAYALTSDTSSSLNSAFGVHALNSTTNSSGNTALGYRSLYYTNGDTNTAVGYWSGYNNTGSGNVFLGSHAGENELGSSTLYISNDSSSNPLIYGNFKLDSLHFNAKVVSDSDFVRDGPSGANRGYYFQTNRLNRWLIAEDVASESGSNAGSDLGIYSYADDGSYLGNPLSLNRATGDATFGSMVTIPNYVVIGSSTNTENAVGLNRDPSNGNILNGHHAGWYVGKPSSDHFQISSFDSAGTLLHVAVDINDTTGNTALSGIIGTGGYVSSASDQSFTNSTTQTNVTGLSVPLQANTTYSFTAQLFTSVAASAGEATSVYYGGNTPTYVIYGIVAEDNSVIDVSNWTNTIGTPFSDNTGSAVTPMVKVQGTITTGSTAANLTIRYAQSTAQTSSNTVKRGSWLHVWQTN